MSYSTNYNLPDIPVGAVEWPGLINDIRDKLEAGRTMKITAGEALTAGQPITIPTAAGKVFKAANTDGFFGIVKADLALDADGFAYAGIGNEITDSGWAWTVGGVIYVGTTAGTLTQSKPTPDAIPIAFANTATSLVLIRPEIKSLSTPSSDGLNSHRIARATYDFAEHGGAIGTIGLGVTLPDNAIVIRSWYEVLTTLQSATDAATIAIDIPTDDPGGIVAAIAINDASNPWDTGLHEAIQDGTVANAATKTTAARELSATIAGEPVTGGKFVLFAEFVVSD